MRTIIRNNYEPALGDYHERIVIDEAKGKKWLFDCDGVFTDISSSGNDFNYLSNRPKYAGETMTGGTNIPQVPTSPSNEDYNNLWT